MEIVHPATIVQVQRVKQEWLDDLSEQVGLMTRRLLRSVTTDLVTKCGDQTADTSSSKSSVRLEHEVSGGAHNDAPGRVAFCTSTAWNLLPPPNMAEAMKVQTVAASKEM